MEDDEHIGPINSHNKSEALPNGCALLVVGGLAFIAVFALYGFWMDGWK
jgi:hypothetical protein